LLVDEGLVPGNEHIKAVLLGGHKEFAVPESIPTHVSGGEDNVFTQMSS
jgi:hypothetical protein